MLNKRAIRSPHLELAYLFPGRILLHPALRSVVQFAEHLAIIRHRLAPLLHERIWSASIDSMSKCFLHTGQMPFCFSYVMTLVFSSNAHRLKVFRCPSTDIRKYPFLLFTSSSLPWLHRLSTWRWRDHSKRNIAGSIAVSRRRHFH